MTERDVQLEREAMELLEQALERPIAQQAEFIEGRTEASAEVRRRALALLTSDREDSASIRTGGVGAALCESDVSPPELAGYRIVRQLGRGGMGTVWLAERDGADFEHSVAIKVIKPGVLIEELEGRFRRERQILAQLNHPNIARLYDGGETPDGQPYIVMEYIPGRTLRDWLIEKNPALLQRLGMFRQIAHAVEFAHQNLVIHRDLTPSNVLVTASDQAKLIDFGIARPQAAEADQPPVSTLSGLSLTPGFAAPERSIGAVSNTLTDIFSLGRILALMVTGEDQPELDAIASRASAHDPADRYANVGDMLDDVDRFVRNEPVAVYSTARSYRFGKLLRRERRLAAATAVLLLSLIGGLGGTAWAYDRAERQRQTAEHRFTQLRDLAHFQLFELHDELDNVIGNTAARIALANRAQSYLLELAQSHSSDRELQLETAAGFIRLALIQGVPAHPNFGEPQQAARNLERARAMLEPLAAQGDAHARDSLALLHSYRSLMLSHVDSKPAEARAAFELAESILDQVPADRRDWSWLDARRKQRMAALGWADMEGDNAILSRYAGLLEREIEDWPPDKRGGYDEGFDRAVAEMHRAVVLQNQATADSLRQSVQRYLAADRLFGAVEASFPNDPLALYWRGWNAYYGYAAAANSGQNGRAESLLSQARVSADNLLTLEEADQSLVTFAERLREAQAQFFANTGRFDQAIALQQGIIAGREAKLDERRRARTVSDLAYGHAVLGGIYRQAGRREEACRSWIEADRLMAELEGRQALSNYVGSLRQGVQGNIAHCRAGAPVTAFEELAQT